MKKKHPGKVVHTINPALRKQRASRSLGAILVHKVCPGWVRATKWDSIPRGRGEIERNDRTKSKCFWRLDVWKKWYSLKTAASQGPLSPLDWVVSQTCYTSLWFSCEKTPKSIQGTVSYPQTAKPLLYSWAYLFSIIFLFQLMPPKSPTLSP